MTEIPEHLLKRSQERRKALGLPSEGEEEGAAPAEGAAPEADLRTARITYVRYKPRDYCRAAYLLDVAGQELDVDVSACLPEKFASQLEDHGATVPGPLGPGILVLKPHCVLIFVYPNDLKLSALQRLADPRERELAREADELD